MFVVFYIVNLYICVFMSCSTACCIFDTVFDPWYVCIYVCTYAQRIPNTTHAPLLPRCYFECLSPVASWYSVSPDPYSVFSYTKSSNDMGFSFAELFSSTTATYQRIVDGRWKRARI